MKKKRTVTILGLSALLGFVLLAGCGKVRARRVHRAGQIRLRLGVELVLNGLGMGTHRGIVRAGLYG